MLGYGGRITVNTVSPAQARDLAEGGSIALIDVREDGEWARSHIPGAIHAPLSRLERLASTLPGGK